MMEEKQPSPSNQTHLKKTLNNFLKATFDRQEQLNMIRNDYSE